jgi:hypothetical protein
MLMGSKVLAVADVVEAMVSHRPYRSALGMDAALAEIEQGAGTLYDSDAAESCRRVIREQGFAFSELPTNGAGQRPDPPRPVEGGAKVVSRTIQTDSGRSPDLGA